MGDLGVVEVDDLARRAVVADAPGVQQDGALAEAVDGAHRVGDEQQGGAGVAVGADALEAFLLEEDVADGERFVDDEDVGAHGGGDGEGEAHLHAAGVGAHGLVEVGADVGEVDDAVHLAGDGGGVEAAELGGGPGVVAAAELVVEAKAEFEQRGDATLDLDLAGGGVRGAGDEFEQGALAGAVDADDAERLARFDAEVEVAQHPGELVARSASEPFEEAVAAAGVVAEGFAELGDLKRVHGER